MTHELDPTVEHSILLASILRRETVVVQSNRVFQSVVEDLRQRIRSGQWLPRERLPSITRLAKELDVSTGSVREALRSLQSMGLVRIEHGRGVFVTDSPPATNLVRHFEDVSIGLIVALAEARRILEPEMAALAAERGTDEELETLGWLARQMESDVGEGRDFAEPDIQFHRQICLAAHNPILQHMMESVHDLFLKSRQITCTELGMTERAVRYHLLIAEAIHDRNGPQARLLMLAHMNDLLSGLLAVEARN